MTIKFLQGDVFDRLAELPDESVHCVVTSPPYWGLRSYGDLAGEIGREPTLAEHIDVLVRVFREVRRVLRPDGTCWLNYGDAYANDGKWGGESGGLQSYLDNATRRRVGREKRRTGLKPKDLMLMPARVALALQADGWWLRSEIIWHKPNPMPEGVTDRPTSAHEKIFLLTKSATYFYDAFAVRTPAVHKVRKTSRATDRSAGTGRRDGDFDRRWAEQQQPVPTGWDTGPGAHGTIHRNGREKGRRTDKQRGHSHRHDGFKDRWDHMAKAEQQANGANLRNVWMIATDAFAGAHFATFPPSLVEPCIKAGCPTGGIVLDPFGGAGTVGLVADRLGRDAVLIELNPEYVEMARARVRNDIPLFNPVQAPQGEEAP